MEALITKALPLIGWDEVRYKALIAKVGPTIVHDHIAAQLRRQVNATGKYVVHIEPHMVIICSIADDGSHKRVTEYVADDGDESDNTIKAIVESKVLSTKETT